MKIIFCDLDGTLLYKESAMQLMRTKEILPKLSEKGYIFCVSSGRTYFELRKYFSDMDIYYLASDGGICVYKKNKLFSFPIDKRLISACMSDYIAYGDSVAYVKSSDELFVREVKHRYDGFVCEISDLSEAFTDIVKIAFYNMKEPEKEGLSEKLQLVYSGSEFTEFTAKGVTKKRGAKELTAIIGENISEIIVFGDNDNDTGLFECADISYAPQSASARIKKAAGHVCASVSNELYKLLERNG